MLRAESNLAQKTTLNGRFQNDVVLASHQNGVDTNPQKKLQTLHNLTMPAAAHQFNQMQKAFVPQHGAINQVPFSNPTKIQKYSRCPESRQNGNIL